MTYRTSAFQNYFNKTTVKNTSTTTAAAFKVATLPSFLGGGVYTINTQNPSRLALTPRNYAGVSAQTGMNRDHIVPVSLGGVSANKANINLVPATKNPAYLETQVANDLKAGRITLGQARLRVLAYKQQQKNQPSVAQKVVSGIEVPLESTAKVFSMFFNAIGQGIKYLTKGAQVPAQIVGQLQKGQKPDVKKAFASAGTAGQYAGDVLRIMLKDYNEPLIDAEGKNMALNALTSLPDIVQTVLDDIVIPAFALSAVGGEISTKNVNIKLTPKDLSSKLAKGEIKTPAGRAVAQELINRGQSLELKGSQPAGGFRQLIGERLLGGQPRTTGGVRIGNGFPLSNLARPLTKLEGGFPSEIAPQTQKSALPATKPLTPDNTAPSVLHLVTADGKGDVYTKITPQQFSRLKDEIKNISAEGQPDVHLSQLSSVQGKIPEVSLQEFAKLSPNAQKTIGRLNASGVARSIEAKAIEQGLVDKGFDNLAQFEGTTFKEQSEKVANLINIDLEKTRSIIRGEQALPPDIRSGALISAMEDIAKKTKDANLMYDLANSPLATKISESGSELSLTRMREKDSATMKLQEIKQAREAKATKQISQETQKATKEAKVATEKVNLSKDDLLWDKFLTDIQC